jgi:hypothetical protein
MAPVSKVLGRKGSSSIGDHHPPWAEFPDNRANLRHLRSFTGAGNHYATVLNGFIYGRGSSRPKIFGGKRNKITCILHPSCHDEVDIQARPFHIFFARTAHERFSRLICVPPFRSC